MGKIFIRSLVTGGVAEKDGRLKIKDRILAIDVGDGLGFQDPWLTQMWKMLSI